LAHKELVGKTVTNLIQFFDNKARTAGVAEPVRVVGVTFTAALDLEGRER